MIEINGMFNDVYKKDIKVRDRKYNKMQISSR